MVERGARTELMPSLVGDNTETVCSKLKTGNSFSKPNFGLVPNPNVDKQRAADLFGRPSMSG